MNKRRRLLFSALAAPAALALARHVQAAWPDKPTSLVVPYPPGGSTDIVGRIIADSLRASLGKPVLVENKPGAGGLIGTRYVARAAPDGYTLLLGTIAGNAILPNLAKDLEFDPIKDFIPIVLLGRIPNILVVNPNLPVRTLDEFVAYAKNNPGKLNVAVNSGGNSTQLSAELFRLKTHTDFAQISYQGSNAALTDLIGGQVDAMFDNLPSSLPQIQSGRLRALAVTSASRSAVVPNLQTVSESRLYKELADYDVASWFGLFAPAKTPTPIIQTLNTRIDKALRDPAVADPLKKLGVTGGGGTQQAFADFVQSELARWGALIKQSGIKLG